ncbi:MAG: hypothetical protein KBD15_01910 [Candidatus Magasanikbacteria bacterium]|jgi:uncharacterized coiled-coil DUF342 family protein|nr:hypothetical protein [Candidatus Magasanikbacteria bacterium]
MNEDKLIQAVVTLQQDVAEIKQVMATKTDIDRVLEAVDSFMGKVKKTEQETVFLGEKVRRVQDFVGMQY